jgi:hypothetical protein
MGGGGSCVARVDVATINNNYHWCLLTKKENSKRARVCGYRDDYVDWRACFEAAAVCTAQCELYHDDVATLVVVAAVVVVDSRFDEAAAGRAAAVADDEQADRSALRRHHHHHHAAAVVVVEDCDKYASFVVVDDADRRCQSAALSRVAAALHVEAAPTLHAPAS